jgi:hypothetical protein
MQTRMNSAILSLLLWGSGAFALQAADFKEISQTIPIDRDGHLYLENFKGSISITTWDRSEIALNVRIDPDGRATDPIEMKKVALTEVRVSGSGSKVTIRTDYDALSSLRLQELLTFHDQSLPFAHYSIQMPATVQLEIKDYKSEIRVSNLNSDLKLNTYKGSVAVAHLDGAARVETYKGTVHLEFARFQKESRFETYKGDIELQMPKDSSFDLDAETGRHGELNSEFPLTISAGRSNWGHSSGAVNGGGPRLRFTTHKGSLRIVTS